MLVELISGLGVQYLKAEDARPVRCPIEADAAVVDGLADVLIGLPGGVDAASCRCPLKRIDRIVERRPSGIELAAEVKPSEQLHIADGSYPCA